MAVKKSTVPYSLADILGTPLSEQEAVSLVSKTTAPPCLKPPTSTFIKNAPISILILNLIFLKILSSYPLTHSMTWFKI